MHEYLSELVAAMPIRDAAEAIGYSRNSMASLTNLCRDYGVMIPPRTNQHSHPPETLPAVSGAYTAPQAVPMTRSYDRVNIALPRVVDNELTVVGGDMHSIYIDLVAWGKFLGYIRYNKPKRVIINGDGADFPELSKFLPRDHPDRASLVNQRKADFWGECEFVREVITKELREAAGDECEIIWVEGNHEDRLNDFFARSPEAAKFRSIPFMNINWLLGLDQYGVTYEPSIGKRASVQVGTVEVGHFDVCRSESGATAKALVLQTGGSVIQNHVHRLGSYFKTERRRGGRVLAGFEAGCLCLTETNYMNRPNWQTGFATITQVRDSNRYHVDLLPILGGELYAGGRRY